MDSNRIKKKIENQPEYPKQLTDEEGIVFEFVETAEMANKVYLYYHRTDGGHPTGRFAEPLDSGNARLLSETETKAVWAAEREAGKQELLREWNKNGGPVF